MSEIGEDFKFLRELKRKKKESNKLYSYELVYSAFDSVEQKNGGYHLVCMHNGKVADFWPSTGKFNIRGNPKYGRGVKNLIKAMKS